jgi:hypothetical protein
MSLLVTAAAADWDKGRRWYRRSWPSSPPAPRRPAAGRSRSPSRRPARLGVETQRQWSDLAILRTTPALLGLFSLVTLWAHALAPHHAFAPRTACACSKLRRTEKGWRFLRLCVAQNFEFRESLEILAPLPYRRRHDRDSVYVISILAFRFRRRACLELELIGLRHQVSVPPCDIARSSRASTIGPTIRVLEMATIPISERICSSQVHRSVTQIRDNRLPRRSAK